MKTIYVDGVPDDLHKRLRQLAHVNHRSLSAQVIFMLSMSTGDGERRNQQANIQMRFLLLNCCERIVDDRLFRQTKVLPQFVEVATQEGALYL